jgi:hypothetical protein
MISVQFRRVLSTGKALVFEIIELMALNFA